MPDAHLIVSAARQWIGTPFHHQGRVMGAGCDCIGLVVGVAIALGVPVRDASGYSRTPSGGHLQAALDAQLDRVQAVEPGRIVLMRFDGEPQHVGIVSRSEFTGELTLIHAWAQARRVVEHHLDDTWHSRITAIYEYRT